MSLRKKPPQLAEDWLREGGRGGGQFAEAASKLASPPTTVRGSEEGPEPTVGPVGRRSGGSWVDPGLLPGGELKA